MNIVPVDPARTVVITGASAGVGRAIVHRFARAGWRIALIARDADALDEVRREVEEMGGEAIALPADVADAQAVFAAADRVASTYGSIDVWVNDAMVTVFSPVSEITPEEFRRVTEVTYLGFVHGTMAALRHMRRALQAIDAKDIWIQDDDTCHLNGTARMGADARTSVVDADCRSWDIPNLWICDGSVFPTVGGANPSLTIQAIACRTADRIKALAGRGEL